MSYDVAVIGGGISGLTTAFDLSQRGYKVVVLERQNHAGGNAFSERMGGFLMEHGPSTVNAQSPSAVALSKRLGLDQEQCDLGEDVKQRYLVGRGELQGIPVHPLGFLLSNYLSFPGRLRLMSEFAVPRYKGGGEETVEEFSTRRFGKEFTDKVIDPLVAGIYAGRASELSVAVGFPKLSGLEQKFGSIAVGLYKGYRQNLSMPSKRLFSWRDGIGTLPATLTAKLGGRVKTGVTVRKIRRRANGFDIEAGSDGTVRVKSVVIATQPHVAAVLMDGVNDTAAAAAGDIQAPPLAVVYLGYKRNQVDHPLDGLGFLAPENEDQYMSGSQFCSTMFPGRAPEGYVAVTGYFGGARAPELANASADDLTDFACEEFANLIGAKGKPAISRVRHWHRGLPQYNLGHQQRINDLLNADKRVPGLFLTGNYFSGPSVAVCASQAIATSQRVAMHLAKWDELGHAETEIQMVASESGL